MQTVREFLTRPVAYLANPNTVNYPRVTNPTVPHGPLNAAQQVAQWNPSNARELASAQPSAAFFAPPNGIVHV